MYFHFAYVRARQRSLYSGLCALLGGVCGQQLAVSAVTSFTVRDVADCYLISTDTAVLATGGSRPEYWGF